MQIVCSIADFIVKLSFIEINWTMDMIKVSQFVCVCIRTDASKGADFQVLLCCEESDNL